jgi:hypothetical protein
MPHDGQLLALHEPPPVPPAPPPLDMQLDPLFVYPEKQSKSHWPLVHFKKPFAGAASGHFVQSVRPHPMFGVGSVQTPPHVF